MKKIAIALCLSLIPIVLAIPNSLEIERATFIHRVVPSSILEVYPYLIKSHNPLLKSILGVRHEFPNGFTAWLNPGQAQLLNLLRI